MKHILILVLTSLAVANLNAQTETYVNRSIQGRIVRAIVVDGDTIPVLDLDSVRISTKKNFANQDERRRYKQIRYNALKVYSYAAQAIKIYRQVQKENEELSKRKGRKSNKNREKELSKEYEDKLKSLTKVQGYILIKMIERELKRPFYDVIKELRGPFAAMKWQALARTWGFNLKRGYFSEEDPMLESILADLNISYGE